MRNRSAAIRILYCVSAFILLLSGTSYAEISSEELTFPDLPWYSGTDKVKETVFGMFETFDTAKSSTSALHSYDYKTSFNFTDPAKIVFPEYIETTAIPTETVYYSSENYGRKNETVAGWPIWSVTARFAQIKYFMRLFEIEYNFYSNDESIMTYEEQFEDIKSKLTAKYGEPYVTYKGQPYEADNCAVWLGANDSAIILYLFYGTDLSLKYGTASVNQYFHEAIEEQAKKEAQEKEQKLQEIIQDASEL